MEKLVGATGAGNFGPPFRSWENRSPHVFVLKRLNFFLGIFPGPQEGKICAATSDFVAISIFPHYGDKCRFLLIEDPALEAQPRREVAVGVLAPPPHPPAPPPPFKGPKCFLRGVRVKDCT